METSFYIQLCEEPLRYASKECQYRGVVACRKNGPCSVKCRCFAGATYYVRMSNPLSVSGADRCSVFPRWAVLAFCVGTALLQAIHATSRREKSISKSVNIHDAKHREEHDGQPAEK